VLASRPLGGDTKNPQSRTDQIELPQQSGKRPAGRWAAVEISLRFPPGPRPGAPSWCRSASKP